MARAPVSKTGGWGFESLHSCQRIPLKSLWFPPGANLRPPVIATALLPFPANRAWSSPRQPNCPEFFRPVFAPPSAPRRASRPHPPAFRAGRGCRDRESSPLSNAPAVRWQPWDGCPVTACVLRGRAAGRETGHEGGRWC
jgi:hypothetical protein